MFQLFLVVSMLVWALFPSCSWAQGIPTQSLDQSQQSVALAAATADHAKDHEELSALRETAKSAINNRTFKDLRPIIVKENFSIITVDGQKITSWEDFAKYWNGLFENKEFGLKSIEVNPVADGQTQFLADGVGVCQGTSEDKYTFLKGEVRTMPERWTAICVKEDGKWKIARFVFSANVLDNPVISAIKNEMQLTAWMAGIIGLIAGGLGMWLFTRKKA